MSDDLISRKAAIEAVSYCGDITVCEARAEIMALPPIDAAPVVHGRWEDTVIGTAKCNLCGGNYNVYKEFMKYCPNCGAKMDGGKE